MDIRKIVEQMTLEEKASLCSGGDGWHTQAIERLHIPAMRVSDGPHGLRKQAEGADNLGMQKSVTAVCFPAGCALAASFDRAVLQSVGDAIGKECIAEGIGMILGPGVNIKRFPLCGRNFEYYSEDPHVSSELAAAYIDGVQSNNVGACIKHFYANNQETRRFSVSAEMDERTAREIYLAAFENAVKKAEPWAVMCAYNRINGVYAAENRQSLTDILRDEWDFKGFVVSDWGAVNDRVPDLEAGLDLEMPPLSERNDERVINAVKTGRLEEAVLDRTVERLLGAVYRCGENTDKETAFDHAGDHEIAKEAALESIVLLKNENVLPLKKGEKIAVIGEFARSPRYQGGGSSHVNAFRVDTFLECVKFDAQTGRYITFAQGFSIQDDRTDPSLVEEAVETAGHADKVLVFAGLPERCESEGYDREHLEIPANQNRLIMKLAEVNQNIIVVLHNGAPVEMPWIDSVKGVLETYLCGEAVGSAVRDILYGIANPSGRLPETFPVRLQDTPAYLGFFGEGDKLYYREGVFVGYRYYDSKEMKVLFPFGHGMSYTHFAYSNLRLVKAEDKEELLVWVDVTNTGNRAGKEVVQLYVRPPKSHMVIRPVHELKGFTKIFLIPGETKTVKFELDSRAFAYFNSELHEWFVESGEYEIEIAKSSQDIILQQKVQIHGRKCNVVKVDLDTPLGDILGIAGAVEILKKYGISVEKEECVIDNENEEHILQAHYQYMPLRGRTIQLPDKQTEELLADLRELL